MLHNCWHNWKRNDFRYSGACSIYMVCVSHKCVLVGYSRHAKKTTFIGGMEMVSLRCNRDFTSASSYGRYKYAIATQWYQFHTTDAWWFSLSLPQIAKLMGPTLGSPGSCWPHMGPILAPWTLLSGYFIRRGCAKLKRFPLIPVWCTRWSSMTSGRMAAVCRKHR